MGLIDDFECFLLVVQGELECVLVLDLVDRPLFPHLALWGHLTLTETLTALVQSVPPPNVDYFMVLVLSLHLPIVHAYSETVQDRRACLLVLPLA